MGVSSRCYLSCLVLLCATIAAASPSDQARAGVNKAALDRLMDDLASDHQVMGSLAITKNGRIEYSRATGYRVIGEQQGIPATRDTGYRIGSISKLFTAAIIFQLVQERRLLLTSTLDRYFPNIPNASQITISDLLSHRSGLSDIKELPDFSSWSQHPRTEREILAAIGQSTVHFLPGTKAEYNNSAYILLSDIIEQVSSKSYAEVLQERITGRLGLKHTYLATRRNTRTEESVSYHFDDGWKSVPETDWSIPAGAGGIVSTPEDMVRFISALFSGAVVNRESLALMKTIRDGYGMGMLAIPFGDRESFGHDGQIDEFACDLQYFPGDRVAVAYCSNGHALPTAEALKALLSAYFDQPYTLPAAPEGDERYRSGLNALLETTDRKYFDAVFNTCDLPFLESLIDADFVFYQDQGYTSATKSQSRKEFMADIRQMCEQRRKGAGDRMRRDVPRASLEVFVVKRDEAIQRGTQHFYVMKEGHEDQLVEESEFSRLWTYKNGVWKISRELDYLYNTHLNAAESGAPPPEQRTMKDEIAAVEDSLKDALNTQNVGVIQRIIDPRAEFYSDASGLQINADADTGSALIDGVADGHNGALMEWLPGSPEVYPIKGFGALAVGQRRSCARINDLDTCKDVSFLHVWKRGDDTWRLYRSVSFIDEPQAASAGARALDDTILQMDRVLFEAFNDQNLRRMSAVFSGDLEFFQDNEGLGNYQKTIADFRQLFERNRGNGLRRDLVPGTFRVTAIPGYGAIEIGRHRFCHREQGRDDCGTFKFVNVWKKEGGTWKVTRAISYGH